jgi:hypothetical protein
LTDWFTENLEHPYASHEKINELAYQTGLTFVQVSDWLRTTRKKKKNENKI